MTGHFRLRPYQERTIFDIRESYRSGIRRLLLVAPTGSGKSAMTSHIIGRTKKRTLILVHRIELLEQVAAGLPGGFGIIAPGHAPSDAQVQIGMMQSVSKRLADLPDFEWVISDEAHLAACPTWGRILNRYESAWHLGMSASPCRLDGVGLGRHFDNIIFGPSVRELTEIGHLVPCRIFAPPTAGAGASDANLEAAAADLDKPHITGSAVEHLRRLAPDRRTLVFTCTRAHAEHVADEFRAGGFSAVAVDGSMTDDERKRRITAFRSGEIQVLTNVDLLTTGYDDPGIEAGVFLRPTGSLAMHLQMCGRFLRPSPGKRDAILLDHVGNVVRHGTPEEDRQWSLDGSPAKKPRNAIPAVRTCPSCYCAHAPAPRCPACGHEYQIESPVPDIVVRNGKLVELDPERMEKLRTAPLRTLLTGEESIEQLRAIARLRGYRRGWATHRLNEHASARA